MTTTDAFLSAWLSPTVNHTFILQRKPQQMWMKTNGLKCNPAKEKSVLIFFAVEEDFVTPLFSSPILPRSIGSLLGI